MSINQQGRPSGPGSSENGANGDTFTGNRALQLEEPLIFEIGDTQRTGVDLPAEDVGIGRLGGLQRHTGIDLPGLSEPEVLRHYVRLSQKNYAIDAGLYPLGSCTMKHNPRINEKMARLPGFAQIYPLQPLSSVPGAIELIGELARWLMEITGMSAVAMSSKAGAHGELCGMMAIKAALADRGESRASVLVPESAHGTNPATAAQLGYGVISLPARDDGTVDPQTVAQHMTDDVAAIMLTNPNTCGLFERDAHTIAEIIHAHGGYFYADGANLNAIMGKVKPGDLGVDAMHINLHKTFSTPHGGGGPGSGPVALSQSLAGFAPLPFLRFEDGKAIWVESATDTKDDEKPFGRMTAFHGQMGMYVRALAWMLGHGSDGIRQVAEDAVLNANYIRACLKDVMTLPFGDDRPSMHEVLFDDRFLDDTGVSTLDFAKAMIDEGYHPMTMYFPLVVHGALLVEPTESESKASLDLFIATLRDLARRARNGDADHFTGAPRYAPRRRLDETRAARHPVLKWVAPEPQEPGAEPG